MSETTKVKALLQLKIEGRVVMEKFVFCYRDTEPDLNLKTDKVIEFINDAIEEKERKEVTK